MDNLTEESPLYPVILVWDHVEHLWETRALLPFVVCISYAFYFSAPWHILVFLVFFYWQNDSSLGAAAQYTGTWSWLLVPLAFILTWTSWRLLRWNLVSDNSAVWDGPAKPYLLPSRTSHTRMFPEKHSFSYSYLLAGIPIGFQGSVGSILSADNASSKGWYDVSSEDYLARGSGHLGLRKKLNNYLEAQGAEPADYPFAYLVTAPRFLGYHFNPVSFWYLYSADKVLSAIVLEVNNTFGERRPYLVLRDFAAEKDLLGREGDSPQRARVKNTWSKDFHVSPFNSRKGSYSLLASDPLGVDMVGFRGIDVTINLTSSKGHGKLVARLFSDGDAIDPSTMSFLHRTWFLTRWFWVGFVTFPRIVKEAARLFFKRKLHVWYRPEPLKESLGRHADATERTLEGVFRRYLEHLVEQLPSPLAVKYLPSGITDRGEETFLSSTSAIGDRPIVQLKVLTPSFYSRFVAYAHDFEAIFCELAESHTIWADKPDLLPKIFLKKGSLPLTTPSVTDYALFKIIQQLRRRPEAIQRPMTSAEQPSDKPAAKDIRDFRISSMDGFVIGQGDDKMKVAYRSAVIKLFLADRLFFGFVDLLEATLLLMRISFVLVLAMTSRALASNDNPWI